MLSLSASTQPPSNESGAPPTSPGETEYGHVLSVRTDTVITLQYSIAVLYSQAPLIIIHCP